MGEQKNDASEFVLKLQDMMQNYQDVVYWNEDETEIIVKDLKKAADEVLPKYFRHRKFQSFVRQLNMYNFYKVCRQKNNIISFKNDIFYKGNENNFCKIKRKKKTDFKTKPSQILDENIKFILNNTSLEKPTKNILKDMMKFKDLAFQTNKKLDSTLDKLIPEMKATKFRKYQSALAEIKQSSKNLDTIYEDIEEYMQRIKNVNLTEIPRPEEQRIPMTNFNDYQRNFDITLSQTNICSTLYEHCEEKRFEGKSNVVSSNVNIEIQTFLSITRFIEPREEIPEMERFGEEAVGVVSHMSRMSIEDQIEVN